MLLPADSALSLTAKTQSAAASDVNALLIDVNLVGQLIGVSTATVWRMRSAGKLPPAVKLSAGCVRWRRADLERWVSLGCPTQQQFVALAK